MNKIVFSFILSLLTLSFASAQRKSLWVWDTHAVVGIAAEENRLINECIRIGITDVYLYTPKSYLNTSSDYTPYQSLIARMSCKEIRVWGMDGWRGYFSDLCGPSEFYAAIQKVINYNAASLPEERFSGFHGNNEFHASETSSGCGPGTAFHYGTKDADLNTTGGGVWKSSAKKDRDSLMTDFVRQTDHSASMCHNAGIEYSIAIMPWIPAGSWTHNAIGKQTTPLYALYKGVNKPLYQHLLDYLDEYVIMSYHTNVSGKVVDMCEDVLTYTNGLTVKPRILSGLETYCGVGEYVSYCDTPGEDNKSHVITEMNSHISLMGTHVSYSGVALHDWEGWKELTPYTTNTSTPSYSSCTLPVTSTEQKRPASSFHLYPNPGQDRLMITSTNAFSGITVKILNAQGVIMTIDPTTHSETTLEFNTELFHPGIYCIQLNEQIIKWIKQ